MQNILKPEEPTHNIISIWGQGGVGKTAFCCLDLSMKPTQPNSNKLGSQLQAHHIGATTNTPGSDPGKLPKNLAKPD
ncbi:MAG: hypothetical protein ACXWPS_03755 [Ktedonobacteraceae bacterium]